MSLWAQPIFGGGRPLPGQALASLAARDATAHAHARAGRIRRPRLAQHVGGALGGVHSRLHLLCRALGVEHILDPPKQRCGAKPRNAQHRG